MIAPLIKKWGIEIEAGWKPCRKCISYGSEDDYLFSINCNHVLSKRRLKLFCGWYIKNDYSIEITKENILGKSLFSSAKEIVTYPPMTEIEELHRDMKKLWKLINCVNSSMGMHIHTSFGIEEEGIKTLMIIGSWEFIKWFQNQMEERFEEIWYRINHNVFCKIIQSQRAFKNAFYSGSRYRSVNLTSIFSHGSVEFRAFPLNADINRAIEYTKFLNEDSTKFIREIMDKNEKIKTILSERDIKEYVYINKREY